MTDAIRKLLPASRSARADAQALAMAVDGAIVAAQFEESPAVALKSLGADRAGDEHAAQIKKHRREAGADALHAVCRDLRGAYRASTTCAINPDAPRQAVIGAYAHPVITTRRLMQAIAAPVVDDVLAVVIVARQALAFVPIGMAGTGIGVHRRAAHVVMVVVMLFRTLRPDAPAGRRYSRTADGPGRHILAPARHASAARTPRPLQDPNLRKPAQP